MKKICGASDNLNLVIIDKETGEVCNEVDLDEFGDSLVKLSLKEYALLSDIEEKGLLGLAYAK